MAEALIKPLVSLLMTAYNREKYIGEAIESVLASAFQDWELIIVDDCSTDNTVGIAKEFVLKDKRIFVYTNTQNLGDYPNRNKAASYATGEYLKYLDADDTIYKYTLSYMTEAMKCFPEAGMGISVNLIDGDKPYPSLSLPADTIRGQYSGKGILGCGPSASVIKKNVFESLGGFSGEQFVGDHEFWLKLGALYPVVKLQPSLIWWRRHPEQQIEQEKKNITVQNIRYQNSLKGLEELKHFFNPQEFIEARKNMARMYARTIIRDGIYNKDLKIPYKLWKMSGMSFLQLLSGLKIKRK